MRIYERTGARNALYGKILGRVLDRLAYYDSFLPRRLSRPARAQLEPVMRPSCAPRLKVGYFLGCASNVFWSQTALTAISYLIARGVEVHLPPTACCGEPHRTCGDEAETRRLAAINSTLIFKEGFDLIATDCSTCAQALAHYDDFVGADSREAERIRPLLGKVVDLNTLVVEHLGLGRDGLRPISHQAATYHDSCHAVRGLGVREAPRLILGAIPDLELREMAGADSCCGGAGSYGFTHPAMSGKIAASKAENIAKTAASIVATSCPACALQLGAGLRRARQAQAVAHPVELLARSAAISMFQKTSRDALPTDPETGL
jgi:glycolate oxidase iron-sulfur subunit